jgi:hypothetical protein
MPKLVHMQDPNDALACATDLFSFEPVTSLACPTTIALRGEDCVPYELEDVLRVLEQQGVGPMTRVPFSVEDIEPLHLVDVGLLIPEWVLRQRRMNTLDRLLVANVELGYDDESEAPWRVRRLLSDGANPNERSNHGEPVVQMAIGRCNEGVFYALLEWGASLSNTRSDGQCALLYAVSCGAQDMVRRVHAALMWSNAAIQKNVNNKSLSETRKRKRPRLVATIEPHELRDLAGRSAIDLAVRKGNHTMLLLLVEELGFPVVRNCSFKAYLKKDFF